jgi:hypothetical protein
MESAIEDEQCYNQLRRDTGILLSAKTVIISKYV